MCGDMIRLTNFVGKDSSIGNSITFDIQVIKK